MRLTDFAYLIKKTFKEWSDDNAASLAAALSYYTSFSLAPMLVVIIAVAGLFGGQNTIYRYVMEQIANLMGQKGAELIASMIQSASNISTGAIAAAVGLFTLLLGALGVFGQLQSSLNIIWEVKSKPVKGLISSAKNYMLKRILSFTMLLVVAFLLLVSLVISAALSALGKYIGNNFSISDVVLQLINFFISLVLISLLFALIFKYLPDAEIRWHDVWFGAIVTALLFGLGKFAIGLYLGKSNIGSTFGAAGSLAILLIWVYYSSQILFLGAEFTQVYANHFGSKIVPEKDAVKIIKEERVESPKLSNSPRTDEGSPDLRCRQSGK